MVIVCFLVSPATVRFCSSLLGRGERLKQAKDEAKIVIDQYRAEKELEFNSSALSLGGDDAASAKALQEETQAEMNKMKTQFTNNSNKALQVLLSKCVEIDLDVPAARIRSAQKAQL